MTKIVDKNQLALALGVKIRQIGNYIKEGMPIHSIGKRNKQMFDVSACKEWRDGNVNKSMSVKTASIREVDIEKQNGKTFKADAERKLKAEADSAELKVKLDDLKLAEAEGRVVDADDLDKSMAEMAIIHKTDKINDENVLPLMLEYQSATEIREKLQKNNSKRLKELDKLINKEFKCDETLYDIVEVVLQQLKDGVEPESLIKRLKGSLV